MEIDLNQLPKDQAALRAIIALQAQELAQKNAEVQASKDEVKTQAIQIDKLTAELAYLRRIKFGRSSEKIDRKIDQLELLLDDLSADLTDDDTNLDKQTNSKAKAKPSKACRKPLPDHLPRKQVIHQPATHCQTCGGDTFLKEGQDITEVLEYTPGSFHVVQHVRKRCRCKQCDTINQAPVPSLPIQRGVPGPALLTHLLVSKFCDHLPLYRQSQIFKRDGMDIARSTMADWVGRASELLEPLVDRIRWHVLDSAYIHTDDTPVPVLDPGRGRTKQARLWVYVRDGRPSGNTDDPPAVCYWYSPNRNGEHPAAHLKSYQGVIHADGYAGYKAIYESEPNLVQEAACMAHARRKFYDIAVSGQSPIADQAIAYISELYDIEAKVRGTSAQERKAARQEFAKPKLKGLKSWYEAQLRSVPNESPIAKAIRYSLGRWPALIRYLDDGRIEIDNNAAERAIRPIALGRKNWLFAGSDNGGHRTAAILTLTESAKMLGLDSSAYLRYVLSHITDCTNEQIDGLLPWNVQTKL